MKKVKRVEFVSLMWILIGLFNFFCVHSSESEDEPDPFVINKCDVESFDSEEEVEQFNKAFGYVGESWVLNFTFSLSLNSFQNRCKIQTVDFQFNSTSALASKTAAVSRTEKTEKKIINALPEFFDHGFFNYEPNFFINSENYCVKKIENRMNTTFLTVEICEPASNSTFNSNLKSTGSNFPPTLQKCCNMGFLLTIDKNQTATCEYFEDPPWKPGNFRENMEIYPNYNLSSLPCNKSVHYILPHQLNSKIKREKSSPIKFKDVQFLKNGGVETRDSGNHQWKKLEQNTYCIDGFYEQLTGDEIIKDVPPENFMVQQCAPSESESGKIKATVIAVVCFISSVVVLIIVIAYVLVWNQQNIHGWTKCAFSLAMFLWLFCTGVRLVHKKDGEKDGFCVFIGVASHFFHISIYSWMLVLNFDLWSTISSKTSMRQRSTESRRFLFFCGFALAIPTVVVLIALIIENQFTLFDDRVIRPQYGRKRCGLDRTALKAYVIYPTLTIFLPNFILIFLTMKVVWDLKERRKMLKREDSKITPGQSNNRNYKNNNIEMNLCLKLFIIMGISWIFDIISGLTDDDEVSWYWMITDIYNIAQPFFLFWLFIYKRTIREQLSEKYSLFKAVFKWMDVHLPRFSSATETATGSGTEQTDSQSHATKWSVVTSREPKSVNLEMKNFTVPS